MSPKKSRKPLDDALAKQFIYGEKQTPTTPDTASQPNVSEPPEDPEEPSNHQLSEPAVTNKAQRKSLLLNKFKIPQKEPTIRFTVDLSRSLHQKLSLLAAKTGKKKADIVRVLLSEALKDL